MTTKIGDIVTITKEQILILKEFHENVISAQAAFTTASNLIKISNTEFWSAVNEIVGEDLTETHQLVWNTSDKNNPKLLLGRTL